VTEKKEEDAAVLEEVVVEVALAEVEEEVVEDSVAPAAKMHIAETVMKTVHKKNLLREEVSEEERDLLKENKNA